MFFIIVIIDTSIDVAATIIINIVAIIIAFITVAIYVSRCYNFNKYLYQIRLLTTVNSSYYLPIYLDIQFKKI